MTVSEGSFPKRLLQMGAVFAVCYYVWKGIIWFVFSVLGLYKSSLLGGLAEQGTFWLALFLGLYSAYLGLVGQKKSFGISPTSDTTPTGQRVRQSVYTLLTKTPTVPRIYITNPFRGVLILGGAGAGKSRSLIEPIIQQSVQQGYAGLLYDFKFPTLAKVANWAMLNTSTPYATFYINFEDLTRSHRVNPLHPDTMPTQSHADEYARVILYNLKPEAIKKSDFWIDSAHSYLTALIWFLREEYPQYCTLPHVMALAFQPTADVVALLSTNPETCGTVASLRESVERKAEGQTAGVVSTLQTALRRINTKEIVWVLSGNDFTLDINDPTYPKFVTLGNSPTLSATFSPVLALLTTVAIKQMNRQDKTPSAIILDEAPTMFIPHFDQLPATGRANKIATIFGAQDISQIEDMYGRNKKDALLSNLNNQFYGRVGHRETAQYISDIWGKQDVEQRTQGESESNRNNQRTEGRSINHSFTERNRVKIQNVLELNIGEFYGQLVESDFSSFKVQIKVPETGALPEIALVNNTTTQDIKENFNRIHKEIESICASNRTCNSIAPQYIVPKPTKDQDRENDQAGSDNRVLPKENLDF